MVRQKTGSNFQRVHRFQRRTDHRSRPCSMLQSAPQSQLWGLVQNSTDSLTPVVPVAEVHLQNGNVVYIDVLIPATSVTFAADTKARSIIGVPPVPVEGIVTVGAILVNLPALAVP
jgi:hypothetical protein